MGAFAQDSPSGLCILRINLLPQVINNVIVSDILPRGLVYNVDSLNITGAATNPLHIVSSPNDGSQPVNITWRFGDVDNRAGENILIQFQAVIADVSTNIDGIILPPSNATLKWTDPYGVVHSVHENSGSVKVIEPNLQIWHQFQPSEADIGDVVTCNLTIQHSLNSHFDAFDANLNESLPDGLIYVPGSMEILTGPKGSKDDSNSRKLHCHFDKVDRSWSGTGINPQRIELQYRATVDIANASPGSLLVNASPSSLLSSIADISWSSASGFNPEKRSYSISARANLSVTSGPPRFNITLAGYPNPVQPGGKLNYTINYRNKGGFAKGTTIQASYDHNTAFISSDPAPDENSDYHCNWTLGDLKSGASGNIEMVVGVNTSLADGTMLISSSMISSQDGASAQDSVVTKVMSTSPSLKINKTASDEVIRPGGTLGYNLTYWNSGNTRATNVTVQDIVDSNLILNPDNSIPRPSMVWMDGMGTHLFWNSTRLNSSIFDAGTSGKIRFNVSLPSVPPHPSFDWVYNDYKVDSDQGEGKFKTLQTAVIHSLYVRKKAENQVYFAGEIVNYTILYGNELGCDDCTAYNAVITDRLPDVEFLEANPAPSFNNGSVLIWNIGDLPPKLSRKILLYTKIPEERSELKFKDSESVSGQGYVNFRHQMSGSHGPKTMTNYVNISATYRWGSEYDSSYATIFLANAFGTEVISRGHGSGQYSREEETRLNTRNNSIQINTILSEKYNPSSFSLPGGRSLNYSSKWSEAVQAKNHITDATITERYMYATGIDRSSFLNLDRNGTTQISETSFTGAGHVDRIKGDKNLNLDRNPMKSNTGLVFRAKPVYQSQEDYLGSFKVLARFDEYGSNAESERSVSGQGWVSVDKAVGISQEIYEHGTGTCQAEDYVQTATNYMIKDLSASNKPISYNYSQDVNVSLDSKWESGTVDRSGLLDLKGKKNTGPTSIISQRFSNLDHINETTLVRGLNDVKTNANFSGKAQFKVISSKLYNHNINNSSRTSTDNTELYNEYIGGYRLSRRAEIPGEAKIDQPHLTITKTGRVEPVDTKANYIITVTNDGNRALGPVYVLDILPPNTQYVYSSLRPSEITSSSAKWILVSLGTGESSRIELSLNITRDVDNLINLVQARGGYYDQWVSAENFSAIELNWLSSSLPQLFASKNGYVDPSNPTLVHYVIVLKNRHSSNITASVTDQLPEGMAFLNSTIAPSNYRPDQLRWNVIDLMPGEIKIIDYWTHAMHSGPFVSQAHIEAFSMDGKGLIFTDVSARVYIGGQYFVLDSDWRPPSCFDLNYTLTGTKDDCVPCDSFDPTHMQTATPICSSCSLTGGEEDIP